MTVKKRCKDGVASWTSCWEKFSAGPIESPQWSKAIRMVHAHQRDWWSNFTDTLPTCAQIDAQSSQCLQRVLAEVPAVAACRPLIKHKVDVSSSSSSSSLHSEDEPMDSTPATPQPPLAPLSLPAAPATTSAPVPPPPPPPPPLPSTPATTPAPVLPSFPPLLSLHHAPATASADYGSAWASNASTPRRWYVPEHALRRTGVWRKFEPRGPASIPLPTRFEMSGMGDAGAWHEKHGLPLHSRTTLDDVSALLRCLWTRLPLDSCTHKDKKMKMEAFVSFYGAKVCKRAEVGAAVCRDGSLDH